MMSAYVRCLRASSMVVIFGGEKNAIEKTSPSADFSGVFTRPLGQAFPKGKRTVHVKCPAQGAASDHKPDRWLNSRGLRKKARRRRARQAASANLTPQGPHDYEPVPLYI